MMKLGKVVNAKVKMEDISHCRVMKSKKIFLLLMFLQFFIFHIENKSGSSSFLKYEFYIGY